MLEIIIDYWFIVLIVATYYFVAMPYLLACFRQNLFNLRAEWFVFATDDKIEFDNDVYKELREMINVFIVTQRYFNIISFVISLVLKSKGKNPDIKSLMKNIEGCNDEQKEKIEYMLVKISKYSLFTLMISSPILSLILAFMLLALISVAFVTNFIRATQKTRQQRAHQMVNDEYQKGVISYIFQNKQHGYKKAA